MARVAERVVQYINEQAPAALCDACIAKATKLARSQQAYHVTNVLELTRDYTREEGECAHCKDVKLVTRRD